MEAIEILYAEMPDDTEPLRPNNNWRFGECEAPWRWKGDPPAANAQYVWEAVRFVSTDVDLGDIVKDRWTIARILWPRVQGSARQYKEF